MDTGLETGAAVETGFTAGREYAAHTAIPPANSTAADSTGTVSEGTDTTVRCARRDFLDLFIWRRLGPEIAKGMPGVSGADATN